MKNLIVSAFAAIFVAAFAHADQIQYLARPEQALAGFVKTASQATKTIDITTFIFEPCDASTQVFMDALVERAAAGVKIRLIIDDFRQTSEQKKNLAAYFASKGIQIGFFNASAAILMRSHMKYIVVDGKMYVAGGRNIADNYFGLHTQYNYADRDVLVTGGAARAVQASFNELWASISTSKAKGKSSEYTDWKKFCPADFTARKEGVKRFLAANSEAILSKIPTDTCSKVQFIADAPDFADSTYSEVNTYDDYDTWMTSYRMTRKRSTKTVLDFLAATKTKMNMEHAIYLPFNYLDDAMAKLRSRKVAVQVITNDDVDEGPDFFKTAVEYVSKYIAVRDSVGSEKVNQLSPYGAFTHAYELTPAGVPFYLHGKIYVRDSKDVIVGSFNSDARSYNTNLESVTVVRDCKAFANTVDREIETLQSIYRADVASGKIPKKPSVSEAIKAFAWSVYSEL